MKARRERLEALQEQAELKRQARAELAERAAKLTAEGLTLGEIAKQLGRTPDSVARALASIGVTPVRKPGQRDLPGGLPG